uniref:Ribonuclease H-like domain-containing protein n=1 Tax=Tanacetum cinerariifolium TaxID=118510 RepID=A0A6L2KXW6_TANCI|nr:ribonuclease H-like domain-containing protein [Tanacetum cinerariifolium]
MIVDSIKNGPYIRRIIATPGEPDLPVPVPESFHEQTDEELTEIDIKRIDADDQAIQTILLGLPEDVYDDRHVTIVRRTKNLHEADFTQIYDFLKMNQDEVNEIRAERLAKSHDPLALISHSQNKVFLVAVYVLGNFLGCVLPRTQGCVLVLRFVSCDLALRFGSAFCLIEDLIASCLGEALPNSKPHYVLSKSLRFVSKLLRFVSRLLRFVSKLVAFCLKTRCVLSQDSLRFISRLAAFCLKTRCVLSQDSLRFVSRLAAFCLKTRCVLSQDTLRFVLRLVAFCLRTRCVCSSLRLAIPLQINFSWSRPNGKMIVDSVENGPYVRRMISTQGEPDLPVLVPESFHEQTDEELTENDIKRMDADDQAIQTILLGLPEDVYAAVDSCETAKEI